MSCVHQGLWYFSTSKDNDIFQVIQVVAVLFEIMGILFYVKVNRSISINSNAMPNAQSIVINDYYEETTYDTWNKNTEKLVKKIKKANKNVILPVYSKLLWLFIIYEITMILYSMSVLVLSVYKIAINTVTKYIIIVFQGFIVNFVWYTFMYLIMWSFVQKSSGTQSWKRSAYISISLGLIHGIAFIFIFYIIQNGLTTTYITMFLCAMDLIIFTFMMLYMCRHPRRRYKQSLICYTLCMFIIHFIWIILNVIVVQSSKSTHSVFSDMYNDKNGTSSFCIYYIFDVLRQLTFPIILFFTLKHDSQYWHELAMSIMSSNHARLSIWDECVEYTFNSNDPTTKYSLDTSKTNLAFDEVVNMAQMQIPIFDWACLGIDQSSDDAMNNSYLGIGTSATVFLGKYKGSPVAIKCILCAELDIETMHLFYKEALLSLSLQSKGKSHPNIVQFLGIAIQPPELCLIYEYCKHKSLTNVLQNVNMYPNINYRQILYIAQDIASGMKYLHKNNIVHRDLKTENVLIHEYKQSNTKYSGKVFIAKVCDFGLARKIRKDQEEEEYDDEDELAEADEVSGGTSPSTSSMRSAMMKSMDSNKGSFTNLFSSFGFSGFSKKKQKSQLPKHRKRTTPTSINSSKNVSLLDEDGYVIDESDDEKKIENYETMTPETPKSEDDRRYSSPRHKPQFMTTEVGTVAFMPPEILENISFQDKMGDVKILNKNTLYANSVDVFAFGCILWELIMRDEVHKQYTTAEDIRKAVLNGEYPKMPQWCPDDYNYLIKLCWEKDPFKRPQFDWINNKLKQMIKATNNFKSTSLVDTLTDDDKSSIASPFVRK